MAVETELGVWQVLEPASWPDPPRRMSYSTLMEIESCPRRWALRCAEYPHIWAQKGYPRPLHLGALQGIVVHESLRLIRSAFADKGCASLRDATAVTVLRELGGFSEIISNRLNQVLDRQTDNPRVFHRIESIRERLGRESGRMRETLQSLVSSIQHVPQSKNVGGTFLGSVPNAPGRLAFGTYLELELHAKPLCWFGFADLLFLSQTECEIRDFKTGEPNPEHEFQIKLYALLWARDGTLNPDQRLPSRLVLSYPHGDVDVDLLDPVQLSRFENEVRKRTLLALEEVQADTPRARPEKETCHNCQVRQLCEEYWIWCNQQCISSGSSDGWFGDVQATITSDNRDGTWSGVVESSDGLKRGTSILFRTPSSPTLLSADSRARFLDVCITRSTSDEESEQDSDLGVVATVGVNSEVFFLQ